MRTNDSTPTPYLLSTRHQQQRFYQKSSEKVSPKRQYAEGLGQAAGATTAALDSDRNRSATDMSSGVVTCATNASPSCLILQPDHSLTCTQLYVKSDDTCSLKLMTFSLRVSYPDNPTCKRSRISAATSMWDVTTGTTGLGGDDTT